MSKEYLSLYQTMTEFDKSVDLRAYPNVSLIEDTNVVLYSLASQKDTVYYYKDGTYKVSSSNIVSLVDWQEIGNTLLDKYTPDEIASGLSIDESVTKENIAESLRSKWYDDDVDINTFFGYEFFSKAGLSNPKLPRKISIGNVVTELKDGAFQYSNTLEELVIPSSVKSFGEYVFYGNRKLRKITYQGVVDGYKAITKSDSSCIGSNEVRILCTDGEINGIGDSLSLPIRGLEAIDLGLSSGTKWASCNVGANKENEGGLYFAWGETQGYTGVTDDKKFDWSKEGEYKWGVHDSNASPNYGMTKYNKTDGLTTLDVSDDAVAANMGGSWKMPTKEEFDELTANTTNEFTMIGTTWGCKYTSKVDTSKYVFFPAVGYFGNGSVYGVGSNGYCWSSSLCSSNVNYAWLLGFDSSGQSMYGDDYRYFGQSVRGVVRQS